MFNRTFTQTDLTLRLRKMRDTIERETGAHLDLDSIVMLTDVCRALDLTSGQALFVIGAENPLHEQVLPYPVAKSRENNTPRARTHVHARAAV